MAKKSKSVTRPPTSAPEPRAVDKKKTSREEFGLILKSVVKIYCTYTKPNFSLPWQMERQNTSTSSGFVVAHRKLLCNAHGLSWHSAVRVRKHGDSTKYLAKVLHVADECDLALITVENETFWEGLNPLRLGGVPDLQDEVLCVGYPTGGDNISVTQGIVSRVAVGKYSHANMNLLTIQIDAAINAGNSGGPAIEGGKVVGVAFESLEGAENIGYIIPVPIVQHFLHDIDTNGTYSGFCSSGFSFQQIENKCMRKALKTPAEHSGILVSRMFPLSGAAKTLKVGDVILAFDGVAIASDGTVSFRGSERVSFLHLVASKSVGDSATLTILRNGKKKKIKVLLTKREELVRSHLFDSAPSYFIYSGLVFTALTVPFLTAEYGKWKVKAPITLCHKAFHGVPSKEGEQVVVMNQVLTSSVNIGYEEMQNLTVNKVNDVKIDNLRQLVKAIRAQTGEYLTLELGCNRTLIVNRAQAAQQHASNLQENNIASECSPDLEVCQESARDTPKSPSVSSKKAPTTSAKKPLVKRKRDQVVKPRRSNRRR